LEKHKIKNYVNAAIPCLNYSQAENIDLFVMAGQSNMLGCKGDAEGYPVDGNGTDKKVRFYWVVPGCNNSNNQWTFLRPQEGSFKMLGTPMNVLFIMTDQQRADCLSCAGHPVLETPNMDRLASKGTMFTNAFVQSAVCGPSRACFYTGRYVHSHNSRWNEVPLRFGEKTLGHYFEEAGRRAAVIGKTHIFAESSLPAFVKPCEKSSPGNLNRIDSVGFEYIAGGVACPAVGSSQYREYLISCGYNAEELKATGLGICPSRADKQTAGNDKFALLRSLSYVNAQHSEVHYLTDKAMQYMLETASPWFLHLSYFRPHHPNYAPAPYNTMYKAEDCPPPVRHKSELSHPLWKEFREERKGIMFDDERYCREWRAVYYGLIREIDDNLGRLFEFMDQNGKMDNTMIIFTSDHGEFAGDHWFFEKELCHRISHHVPCIIRHPNGPKGKVNDAFVESVDIVPTCLDAAGLPASDRVQGRSLLPLLDGSVPENWRKATYAEWTFEYYKTPLEMNLPPERCKALIRRDENYLYTHFNGLPDLLFDLKKDPDELRNVATDPAYADVLAKLRCELLDWILESQDPHPLRWRRDWPYDIKKGRLLNESVYRDQELVF
jgi:arylsulfatase A-like enzyme